MEFIGSAPTYILAFLAALGVLVFFHELGHFLVARWCGVRVEVFSIGFGRELFGWNDRAGTRWKVSILPLGGYVKMFGDADASSRTDLEAAAKMSPEERAVSFPHKSLLQRCAIVSAGPIANFILAIVVFAGLFMSIGQPYNPPEVSRVVEGGAAERAGIVPGDLIVRVDGAEIRSFQDLQRLVRINLGTPMEFVVVRDGRERDITLTPDIVEQPDPLSPRPARMGRIGVASANRSVLVQHDPLTAVGEAVTHTFETAGLMLRGLGQIITGQRSLDEMSGPVGIAHVSGEISKLGIVPFIQWIAFLSISLGLLNLFPIPVLDGGHLLYYLIEAVRGRPLGERAQEIGNFVGLAVVGGLMVLVTANDIWIRFAGS